MTMGRVLVTGASGFVGSAILDCPGLRGRPRVGLVRRGKEGSSSDNLAWRSFDNWTQPALAQALDQVDTVIHAASVVHRPDASLDEYTRFNVEGTRALVRACEERGVRRLVFLSSIKVYGERPGGIIDEQTSIDPQPGYAQAKLAAERVVEEASARNALSTMVLRLCPVFGRGEKGNVRAMIRSIARRRFLLPGDGSTRKSIVHISTVSNVARAAADATCEGAFVVSDSAAPTMRGLVDAIARVLGQRSPPSIPIALVKAGTIPIEWVFRALSRAPPLSRALLGKLLEPTVCSPARIEAAGHLTLVPAMCVF